MEQTIEKLRQSQNWIIEALALIEKDNLESYLDYFQVGYVSGNWHLPTIVTKPTHEVHRRLAQLMNARLSLGDFYIDEDEAVRNGSIVLFYKEERIGVINLMKREIYGSTDYQYKVEQNEKKINHLYSEVNKLENTKLVSSDWIAQNANKRPIKGLFFQKEERKHRGLLAGIDEEIAKLNSHVLKVEEIYQQNIDSSEAVLAALPFLSEFMREYGIAMQGYLNFDRKRYSFYHLIEKDQERAKTYLSKNNSGGIYHVAPFVAFSEHFLKRFRIEDVREEFMVKSHEVIQKQFYRLVNDSKEMEVEIENITFTNKPEAAPQELKMRLIEALQNKKIQELSRVAMDYQEEGHDVEEIHFKFKEAHFIFNRFAEVSLQGQRIKNENMLNSPPIRLLLGIE